jgi:site-specific DNA-cytosine methylase
VASASPRLLELYCGIGGCAAAVGPRAAVVAALDIDTTALAVYRRNFAHPASACALESLRPDDRRLRDARVWWLSPPCQPHTRRGKGLDVDDPRSKSFLHLLELVARLRPPELALENVPEMRGSRAHARLREVLDGAGYAVAERILCPTELGVPNRRKRFYLVASRDGLAPDAPAAGSSSATAEEASATARRPLADFLAPDDPPDLRVDPDLLRRYARAADVVDAADPAAVTATFTAAYGRSPVRAAPTCAATESCAGSRRPRSQACWASLTRTACRRSCHSRLPGGCSATASRSRPCARCWNGYRPSHPSWGTHPGRQPAVRLAAMKVLAMKNDPARTFQDLASDAPSALPDLERDLPTTSRDIEAQRRLRERLPTGARDATPGGELDARHLLAARPSSEGWPELVL